MSLALQRARWQLLCPLPLWERACTGDRTLTRVRGSLHGRARGENPSSGASRHLLPQGEKVLARRHTDGAVEADGLAVEHRVLDDVDRERGIFRGLAETRGMRHLCAEALARLLVQSHQERRVKYPGRDGVDADLLAGEIARRRQRQADDAALRCGIGDLADLAFISRDTCRVDDDATLLTDRLSRDQALGEQPQAVKGADQIDIDDARELRQRIDAVATDDALRAADA